jgi:hypothetical protein
MATRRRSSGFTAPQDDETKGIEEFLDESAREMFETISRNEEEAEAKVEEKAEAPLPVVLPEITPTEDVGPRFVEESPTPQPQVVTPPATPHLQPPPKRHPRNIPKFSRYK